MIKNLLFSHLGVNGSTSAEAAPRAAAAAAAAAAANAAAFLSARSRAAQPGFEHPAPLWLVAGKKVQKSIPIPRISLYNLYNILCLYYTIFVY